MFAVRSGIFCLILLMLPVAGQAATIRADYLVGFVPPSPCDSTSLGDLSGASLGGTLQFFSQSADGGGLVAQNPGPPVIGGVACGGRAAGAFEFDLDLAAGAQLLFVSFEGSLVDSNPGPPILPLYAFLPGDDVSAAPAGAPVLPLGLISLDTNPGPPTLPLYAFASPGHEVGSLQVAFSVVPVPGSLVLLASGLLVLGRLARGHARASSVNWRESIA